MTELTRRRQRRTDDADEGRRLPAEGGAATDADADADADSGAFHDIAHPKKRAFLAAYARTGNITQAAAAAGITRRTHYVWLDADGEEGEAYRAAFEDAKEQAADYLEAEARRRAVEGLVRYRFDRAGNPLKHPVTGEPYYELEYSDTLLIFLLKGARPDKYADRTRTEITGRDGAPLGVVMLPEVREVRDDGADDNEDEYDNSAAGDAR